MASTNKLVTILASHNVTPNQPTPNDPLWLSDSDQIGYLLHVSTIYIYKAKHSKQARERLRNSLSKILVHYYPVAGRLRLTESGRMEVNCNAKGVTFLEAETTNIFADYGDLLGMPIYEADFGWGKPMHYGLASSTFQEDRVAVFQNSDGDGVAVIMYLPTALMQLFKILFYENLIVSSL